METTLTQPLAKTHTVERFTREQFLQREAYLWGEDYIDALLDEGYLVVRADNPNGWAWFQPA